jgi:hypothetical protein
MVALLSRRQGLNLAVKIPLAFLIFMLSARSCRIFTCRTAPDSDHMVWQPHWQSQNAQLKRISLSHGADSPSLILLELLECGGSLENSFLSLSLPSAFVQTMPRAMSLLGEGYNLARATKPSPKFQCFGNESSASARIGGTGLRLPRPIANSCG